MNKRLFIAIDISTHIKNQITTWQAELKKHLYKLPLRWSLPQNSHLTLKFIGDFPNTQIPSLNHALSQTLIKAAPTTITFTQPGVFPHPHNPKVLWLGCQPSQTLSNLVAKIDQTTHQFNIPLEKRAYKPHLTLARVKKSLTNQQKQQLQTHFLNQKSPIHATQKINQIHLIQSTLQPHGPHYQKLTSFELTP